MEKTKLQWFLLPILALLLEACGSSKNVPYFQNRDTYSSKQTVDLYDARIMPKDVLTITVNTVNPLAAQPFNLLTPTSQTQLQTYLVDNDGKINFPIVGELKLGGLTKNEAENLIAQKVRLYLSETEKIVVTVRMSSFSVSVLGEVNLPGTFQISREKINVLEALSRAGDMTIFGVRDHVILIREDSEGHKSYHTLDLKDAHIVDSPYYYLQQNDIVYVEPNKAKAQNSAISNSTSLWMSALGILVSVATLLVSVLK